MRTLTLFIGVIITSLTCAGSPKSKLPDFKSMPTNELSLISKIQTRSSEVPKMLSRSQFRSKLSSNEALRVKGIIASNKKNGSSLRFISAEKLMELNRKASSPKEILDSVIMTSGKTGTPQAMQKFLYDYHKWPSMSLNFTWNPLSKIWEYAGEYGYDWSDKGKCLKKWSISGDDSFKYEYEYNSNNMLITQTTYGYNNGSWIPSKRGTYSYNDANKVTEEMLYNWVDSTSSWNIYEKHTATYDDQGREASYGYYSWDETKKDWNANLETYEYDEQNRVIRKDRELYDTTLKDFTKFKRNNIVFTGDKMTHEDLLYWNKTTNDWDGVETYDGTTEYNCKIDYLYDKQGRDTTDNYYQKRTLDGDYVLTIQDFNRYDDFADGSYNKTTGENFYIEDNGNLTLWPNNKTVEKFNSFGGKYHSLMSYYSDGDWLNEMEDSCEWNDRHLDTEERVWMYNYDNARVPSSWLSTTYDDNDNDVLQVLRQGADNATTDNDWVNSLQYKSAFENDSILVSYEEDGWSEETTDWVLNKAFTNSFDYNTPMSDVRMWNGLGLQESFKLLQQTQQYGATKSIITYYYSSTSDDIKSVNNNQSSVSVYPNPVTDQLFIKADGDVQVVLYSANGAVVKKSSEKQINVSDLSKGIYLVRVNGETKKIIKK